MKWHDSMINDNLVRAVLATLAAACWTPPPPHTSWVWPRPTTTAFYPQEPILTYLKLYQKPLVLLLPLFTGSELKYLALKDCIPLFLPSRCILPRGAPYCSLVLTTWGRWAPYYSKSLLALWYISAATDHSTEVPRISLMPSGTTYMNYACLKWTLRIYIWLDTEFLCLFLILPLHKSLENVELHRKLMKMQF